MVENQAGKPHVARVAKESGRRDTTLRLKELDAVFRELLGDIDACQFIAELAPEGVDWVDINSVSWTQTTVDAAFERR